MVKPPTRHPPSNARSAQERVQLRNARAAQNVKADTRAGQKRRDAATELWLDAVRVRGSPEGHEPPPQLVVDGGSPNSVMLPMEDASGSPMRSADLTVEATRIRESSVAENRHKAAAVRESAVERCL